MLALFPLLLLIIDQRLEQSPLRVAYSVRELLAEASEG